MRRRLPPLRSIQYFERAAEQESFAAAAEDCGVSKGAISQQVKVLEDWLGAPLFVRAGRRVTLTDTGRRYHSAVRSALNLLERETVRIAPSRHRSTLRVSALPAFAALWLVPRLAGFQSSMPHIDIQVAADPEVIDFARSDAHLGVRYGGPDDASLAVTELGRDALFPVCSPSYQRDHRVKGVDDLARCRLLHDTFWSDDWSRWFASLGRPYPGRGEGQYFTHYSMVIDTALAGGGVAMGHSILVAALLARGALVRIGDHDTPAPAGYRIVVPEHFGHLDYVIRFREWAEAQMRRATAAGA